MKIIRITTDNNIFVHEFPEGTYTNVGKMLKRYIGPKCEIYEHVRPRRLYTALGASANVSAQEGNSVCMLVDEEGIYHDLEVNSIASWLYESDIHGHCILGNVLIVGEVYRNGIDFCGISDNQFELIYPQLEKLVKKARMHR